MCYECGTCYDNINQLESYSVMKSCDTDDIEIHTDSSCTSYAGLLKDTCIPLDIKSSLTITSGDCLDLIVESKKFSLFDGCPDDS